MLDILFERITEIASKNDCSVGIGCDKKHSVVINESLKYCRRLGLSSVETYDDNESLINALNNGDIDAAVRGNLAAKPFITSIKNSFAIEELCRSALLQTAKNDHFFLTPVGIDEGQTIESKIQLVNLTIDWLNRLNIEARVGVLSGGREEDFGRYDRIDYLIRTAEVLTTKLLSSDIKTKNFGILLEDAVNDSNIIVVPDGVIGNYVFRTLYHLGGGNSIGAPILNLPVVAVDTSRTKREYFTSIILAAATFNLK